MTQNLHAHIALFIVALIYGANYTIAKEVMDNGYIQPLGFILLRVTTAVILFIIIHFTLVKEKVDKGDLFLLFLCGMFGVAINQMMFFMGLSYTKPIHASLIMTTAPILVLVASSIIIKERITAFKIVGIALGMTGAVLLIVNGKDVSFGSKQLVGDIMVFINASSYGIYLVLVRKLMAKYNPLTVVKWTFMFGWILVFPFGISQLRSVQWAEFGTAVWLAVIYVLLFTTFLAYLLNAFALKKLNPSVVSIYIYLQPVFASVIALAAGRDTLSVIKIVSTVLIFVGVYLVSVPRKRVKQVG